MTQCVQNAKEQGAQPCLLLESVYYWFSRLLRPACQALSFSVRTPAQLYSVKSERSSILRQRIRQISPQIHCFCWYLFLTLLVAVPRQEMLLSQCGSRRFWESLGNSFRSVVFTNKRSKAKVYKMYFGISSI